MNKIWETGDEWAALEQAELPYPGDAAIAKRFRAKTRPRRRFTLRAATIAAVVCLLACVTVLAATLLPLQEARDHMGIQTENPVEGWLEFGQESVPPAVNEAGTVELLASIRSEEEAIAYFVITPVAPEVVNGNPKSDGYDLYASFSNLSSKSRIMCYTENVDVISYDTKTQAAVVRCRISPDRGMELPEVLVFHWKSCCLRDKTYPTLVYAPMEVPLVDGGKRIAELSGTVSANGLEAQSIRAEVTPLHIRLITEIPLPEGTQEGDDISVYLCSWNDALNARADTTVLVKNDGTEIAVCDLPSWHNFGWFGVEFDNTVTYAHGDRVEVPSLYTLEQALDLREYAAVIVDGVTYPLN